MNWKVFVSRLFCTLGNILPIVFGQSSQHYDVQPEFNTSPVNVTVISGNTAVLPCSVRYIGKHRVAWVNERSTIVSLEDKRVIDDLRISVERPFVEDWNLHIRNVRTNDTGVYKCQVNTKPVKMKYIYLRILAPPVIIDHLSTDDMMVKEGETVTLVCNVTGTPPPTVQWYRKQIHEDALSREQIGVEGEVLIIHNITRYCDDKYECVASNGVSAAAGRTTRITVEVSPEVTLINKKIGQQRGKETILECDVMAFPHGVSQWQKDGKAITTNTWKYRADVYRNKDKYNTITLSLKIRDIDESDFGEYVCYANNKVGEDRETMILYEYIPPRAFTSTSTTPEVVTTLYDRKNAETGNGFRGNKIQTYIHKGGSKNKNRHNDNRINQLPRPVKTKDRGHSIGYLGSSYGTSSKTRGGASQVTPSVLYVLCIFISYRLLIASYS